MTKYTVELTIETKSDPRDILDFIQRRVKDARNRWFIHTVEVKEVWDVHVDLFNKVKPHALSAHDYVVKRYQELTAN